MSRSSTTTEETSMAKRLPPIHPGEILLHDFMEPMGITRYRLSKDIDVPPQRIGDIVAGKRAITADTDLRLCRYFRLTARSCRPGPAQLGRASCGERVCQSVKI